MTQEHPITPPPELVQEWSLDCPLDDPFNRELYVATLAARWGADQELEACCELVRDNDGYDAALALRADRRPKPPSLKEQALESLHHLEAGCAPNVDLLRRALESLPD